MTWTLNNVCVFCGSNPGKDPLYMEHTQRLGAFLARQNITVVYGGARLGLMGAVADSALEAGGKVIGVIPQALKDKEMAHMGLTERYITKNMHERKQLMADKSDAFILLPGGLGSYEEFFEMITWSQLGFHKKPLAILNTLNFYDDLIRLCQHGADQGFMPKENLEIFKVTQEPEAILDTLNAAQIIEVNKWVGRD